MKFDRQWRRYYGIQRILLSFSCVGLLGILTVAAPPAHATAMATIVSAGTGEAVEYKEIGEDGTTQARRIPIYKQDAIRYFSAGVGAEERAVQYPPFSLKLIFVAGEKAYLSQVTVTIEEAKGRRRLQIPAEQSTGPWLFVDLPAGAYTITAVRHDHAPIRLNVNVTLGHTRTSYLRWKE